MEVFQPSMFHPIPGGIEIWLYGQSAKVQIVDRDLSRMLSLIIPYLDKTDRESMAASLIALGTNIAFVS